MQLRLKPRNTRSSIGRRLIIKSVLVIVFFSLGIFLLDKIDFPNPVKNIKQEISNDKFIKLK